MIIRRALIKFLAIAALYTASFGAAVADTPSFKGPYDHETKEQRDQRMSWWREAKFGLFIHWGIYSVPAGTH